MYKAIRYFFLLGILFPAMDMQAQRLGYLPSKINWQQLKDDSLRIIFPEGQEENAKGQAQSLTAPQRGGNLHKGD